MRGAECRWVAVEGDLCRLLEISLFDGRDVIHDLDVHRTDLRTGVTGEAAEQLRIKFPDLLCHPLELLDIEGNASGGIERDLSQVHS